jgi:hypothetical protein
MVLRCSKAASRSNKLASLQSHGMQRRTCGTCEVSTMAHTTLLIRENGQFRDQLQML